MTIVVIGGSGFLGAKLVGALREKGHEVLAASPRTGVDSVTGEGLDVAITGGDVVVDVTNPRRPFLLEHLPAEGDPNVPDDGGSQMVQVCSGDELPGGEAGKYYLLRTNGDFGHQIYDVTDPSNPVFIVDVTTGLDGTHKNWWERDTGFAI